MRREAAMTFPERFAGVNVPAFRSQSAEGTTMNTATIKVPISTLDPYTDQALLNPWPLYRELRETGPVVWLEKYGMFALTRMMSS
jgi:hypothetical protein